MRLRRRRRKEEEGEREKYREGRGGEPPLAAQAASATGFELTEQDELTPFAKSVAPAAAMKKRANEKKTKSTNPVTTLND